MRAPWNASKPAAPVASTKPLRLEALEQPGLFMPSGEPLRVAIGMLDDGPDNPRTEFPPEQLAELAHDVAVRGVLQPIVVAPADEAGRHRIRFGSLRWRAARDAGLTEVPVVVAVEPRDAYDRVAENQKRHGLSPLDLARFIRGRVDAGESNATIASRLAMDQTTVAHHLALLDLPPILDAALKSGRCTSPRTLYELGRLHEEQPARVAQLMAGDGLITREAVARLREAEPKPVAAAESAAPTAAAARTPPAEPAARLFARANALCDRLDGTLARLTRCAAIGRLDELAVLRQRVAELARRLDA